jgi:hypothetical protein
MLKARIEYLDKYSLVETVKLPKAVSTGLFYKERSNVNDTFFIFSE